MPAYFTQLRLDQEFAIQPGGESFIKIAPIHAKSGCKCKSNTWANAVVTTYKESLVAQAPTIKEKKDVPPQAKIFTGRQIVYPTSATSKVIAGFTLTGKTYLSKKDVFKLDLDFEKYRNNVKLYIDKLLAEKNNYEYIMVSANSKVLEELGKYNIKYLLVYPDISLKQEYINRAKAGRKKQQQLIIEQTWEQEINRLSRLDVPQKILQTQEYLEKIIPYD